MACLACFYLLILWWQLVATRWTALKVPAPPLGQAQHCNQRVQVAGPQPKLLGLGCRRNAPGPFRSRIRNVQK